MSSWIKNKFSILKSKINRYFLLEDSLIHLANVIYKFYIFSIGFNDIYDGIKNPKRFIICIFNCGMVWLIGFYFLSFALFDNMFSLMMDITLFAGQLKRLMILDASICFLVATFKTDILLGEINCNMKPFKVIYYLMNNIKNNHKLSDKNYTKLAFLSRIIIILLLDCASILLSSGIILFDIKMSVLSNWKLYWITGHLITPIFINIVISVTSITCLAIILFMYYKMIFDQINHQINQIFNLSLFKRRIINKKIKKIDQFD